MHGRDVIPNKLCNIEWTLFTNWKQLLEPRESAEVYNSDIEVLLEVIISLSVQELDCDRRKFEKVFKEKNREFFSLKKAIYKRYYKCDADRGAFVALKRLLFVPANISIFK